MKTIQLEDLDLMAIGAMLDKEIAADKVKFPNGSSWSRALEHLSNKLRQGRFVDPYAPSIELEATMWISPRESIAGPITNFRWPCVFNHYRDGAVKYIRTDQVAALLDKGNKIT